jgi:hypothetical protein
MTTPILLPPLPEPDFALDQGDEPCYYAHTLRARDIEVARAVLEDALQRYVNYDLLTGTRGKMNEIARAALKGASHE